MFCPQTKYTNALCCLGFAFLICRFAVVSHNYTFPYWKRPPINILSKFPIMAVIHGKADNHLILKKKFLN